MDTFSELHDQQSDLLRKRLMMTRMQQTEDWTEEEVVKVLKSLKNNNSLEPGRGRGGQGGAGWWLSTGIIDVHSNIFLGV